jgi:hypothetical protein
MRDQFHHLLPALRLLPASAAVVAAIALDGCDPGGTPARVTVT